MTPLFFALDGKLLGVIAVADVTREDSAEAVREKGYEPAVYFYRDLGYKFYELDRLAELTFWAGAAGSAPDFHYKHTIWQYSFTGQVSGVEGDCDLDLYFVYPAPEPAETPGTE